MRYLQSQLMEGALLMKDLVNGIKLKKIYLPHSELIQTKLT
jgi:hypothetical protein